MADQRQVVIVTGSKQGIGLAIAQRLASDGIHVVMADVMDASAEAAAIRASGNEAMAVQIDVCKPEDTDRMVKVTIDKYGRLDALINNAAVCEWGTVLEHGLEMWEHIVSTNLRGPYLCSRAALPAMKASGGGVIINVGSEYGIKAGPSKAIYSAAKAGLHHLSKTMAVDHAADGIRVNCLIPGPVRTRLMDKFIRESADPDLALKSEEASTVLKRLGKAEEIAEAALFLISPRASFISGALIPVDGGVTAQ